MKNAALMRRALELCAPLFFSLTIMLSAGNIAQAQGDASAVPELEAAHNRVQEATMAMKQAEDQNNTRAMERARNNYNKANQNMAQNLARVAGVRTEDVTGMQRAGMGWGQIAQELGLEPEHLGKQGSQTTTPDRLNVQERTRDRDRNFSQQDSIEPERTRERERTREKLGQETDQEEGLMVRERTRERNREFSEATSRNMKNAGATKHGMAMVGSGSKGMGLGKAKGAMSAGTSQGSSGHGGSGSGGSGDSGGGGSG
ncbi:MAG: hypothetical protein IMF03_07035, partial [Proteobacteria bacterium]|nr:hypothetical protein [Pseudomonadota bacterium]